MSSVLTQVLSTLSRPFQWWVIVAPWERGLRVRFGRTADTLMPGPHFRIPFVDRVFLVSVRLRAISEDGQTMTTSDGRVVTVALAVQYAIEDIEQFYSAVANPDTTLLQLAAAAVAKCVAATPSDDLSAMLVEDCVTAALPSGQWGLGQVRAFVTTFAFVRTYRLLMHGYKTTSSLENLDEQKGT